MFSAYSYVHILFLNLFIVLTSKLLLPEVESADDDGFISQQVLAEIEAFETSIQDVSIFEQVPSEAEAAVEPGQEEIAVSAVNKTMTVPSG